MLFRSRGDFADANGDRPHAHIKSEHGVYFFLAFYEHMCYSDIERMFLILIRFKEYRVMEMLWTCRGDENELVQRRGAGERNLLVQRRVPEERNELAERRSAEERKLPAERNKLDKEKGLARDSGAIRNGMLSGADPLAAAGRAMESLSTADGREHYVDSPVSGAAQGGNVMGLMEKLGIQIGRAHV